MALLGYKKGVYVDYPTLHITNVINLQSVDFGGVIFWDKVDNQIR